MTILEDNLHAKMTCCIQDDQGLRITLEINLAIRLMRSAASMVQLCWGLGSSASDSLFDLAATGASSDPAIDKFFTGMKKAFPSTSSVYFGWTGSGDQVGCCHSSQMH